MKTIRPPKKPPKPIRVTCKNDDCKAIMECELKELRLSVDQRDGDARVMVCPHCKGETWISI